MAIGVVSSAESPCESPRWASLVPGQRAAGPAWQIGSLAPWLNSEALPRGRGREHSWRRSPLPALLSASTRAGERLTAGLLWPQPGSAAADAPFPGDRD